MSDSISRRTPSVAVLTTTITGLDADRLEHLIREIKASDTYVVGRAIHALWTAHLIATNRPLDTTAIGD